MIRHMTLSLVLMMLGTASLAQSVAHCDWRARLDAVPEPFETHVRSFANGAVRLALTDTIEPAAGAFHLVVVSPPYDEVGARQCRVVSLNGSTGFAGIDFAALQASYDPAVGLIFTLQAQVLSPDGTFAATVLDVRLNQATGDLSARLAR